MSALYHDSKNENQIPSEKSGQNQQQHAQATQSKRINFKSPIELSQDAEIIKRLNNAPLTDAGNAECFATLFSQTLRYCKSRKKWLKWAGYRWIVDTDGAAHRAAIITARMRQQASKRINNQDLKNSASHWSFTSESVSRRNAMLNTAMHLDSIETRVELFDQNSYLAGVRNGTLDLSLGGLRESNRDDYISMQFNVEHDNLAAAPRWKQFLQEVFAGDEELISFIQRAIGYSLTGDTSEQVMFLCVGNGANGKSVFLDVISHLLGDYAANCSFSTFEANKRNEATNDLAALKGKRLVTVIETDEDKRLAEARVKSVTGQDFITCRFLYGEFFSYKPSFKIWMAVNHKPLIRGTDRGIWRRIRLIPFTQNFEDKADPQLTSKLKAELPGILNWALEGLKKWQEQRLGTAYSVQEASENYRKESDLIQQWLDELTTLDAEAITPCSSAYESFVRWLKGRGYPVWSLNSFGRAMTEKGFEKRSNGKRREYVGLKLDDLLDQPL